MASRKINSEPVEVLAEAKAIANEWVTTTRLQHVLDKIPGHNISMMQKILAAMLEDVLRMEIVDSKEARKAVCQKTVTMYKEYLGGQWGWRYGRQWRWRYGRWQECLSQKKKEKPYLLTAEDGMPATPSNHVVNNGSGEVTPPSNHGGKQHYVRCC